MQHITEDNILELKKQIELFKQLVNTEDPYMAFNGTKAMYHQLIALDAELSEMLDYV